VNNQQPVVRFHTFSGQQYQIEYSPDFSPGSWTALPGGAVAGNGFDASVTDPQPATAFSKRFYRLEQ
jgi:hypothetical protein